MGSEQNDSTSVPPSEPKLCVNGCGFFGSPSNMNLCSKCFRDFLLKEEQAAAAKAAVEKSFKPADPKPQEKEQEAVATADSSTALITTVGLQASGSDEGEPSRVVVPPNRCFSCKKKVGLTGFKCKCGSTFCGVHRYPEKHECNFDFKESGRDALAKANPVVKADKVQRI